MSGLRVLADDLTGALDAAARFVPVAGPVPAVWRPPLVLPWPAAVDAGTRALPAAEAARLTEILAPVLEDAEPAYLKIDSLLRGHVATSVRLCCAEFDHCVIAPAFPAQGRVTAGGRQFRAEAGAWHEVPLDLPAALAAEGLRVRLCRPGDVAPEGVSLWDAETDAELDAVAAEGRVLAGRVLWCGSAGLAGALAGWLPVPVPLLPGPILALVGSDHPVSVAQLSTAWKQVHRITHGGMEEAAPIARRLDQGNAAVAVVVPPGSSREGAAAYIAGSFGRLLAGLDRPGTLVVSGGETLRAVADALGATMMEVDGELEPGVPASLLRGGRWHGLRVVSKSGAFGDSLWLARLLAPRPDGDGR
jgi:D-threonate/D-erythronate kinase